MLNVNQRIKLYMYFNTKLIWNNTDVFIYEGRIQNPLKTSKIGMKGVLMILISEFLL